MIRPSARWLLRLCPSSQSDGYRLAPQDRTLLDLGTATHRAMSEVVLGWEPDIAAICNRLGVDPVEVAARVDNGRRLLDVILAIDPEVQPEVRLDGPLGSGTADVVGDLLVADWKAREGEHHWDQVMHYAHSLRHERHRGHLAGKEITLLLGWLSTGTYEIDTVGDGDLDDWDIEQRRLESEAGQVYGPGEACGYCHRRYWCGPHQDWTRSALAVLTPDAVDVDRAAAAYPRVQELGKLIDQYRAALRDSVAASGPIYVDDGRELALINVDKGTIDPTRGRALLTAIGWTSEEIDRVSSIQIGAVRKAAGGKKKSIEDIERLLEPATTYTRTQQLRLRKART